MKMCIFFVMRSLLLVSIGAAAAAFAASPGADTQNAAQTVVLSYITYGSSTKLAMADGALRVDLATGSAVQIVPRGGKVEAVSPDGTLLLVSQADGLYLADLDGNLISRLGSGFSADAEFRQAYFSADGLQVWFIARDEQAGEAAIYASDLKGTQQQTVVKPGTHPLALFPSMDLAGVYWLKGTRDKDGVVKLSAQKYTSLTGKETTITWRGLNTWTMFSPDFSFVAFLPRMSDPTRTILNVSRLDGRNKVDLIGPRSPDKEMKDIYLTGRAWSYPLAWSPDGKRLLARIYRQLSGGEEFHLFDAAGNVLERRLPLTASVSWSPDGNQIAYWDGSLNVYDLPTHSLVRTIPGLPDGSKVSIYWLGNRQP